MLYDKYTKINKELSEMDAELSELDGEQAQFNSQLETEKKQLFKDLLADKTEIRSGIRVSKIKSKDFKFRFKLFFLKLLWLIYN